MDPLMTSLSLAGTLSASLDAYQSQLSQLQVQLASGQAIQQPSDNPAGTVDLLGAQTQLASYQQYQANLSYGQTVAQLANASLSQAVSIVQQARSVILQAGAPGVTPSVAKGLAQQLQGLETSLLGVANTTYEGQAIFAGTSAAATAYSQPGGPGTPVTYLGNQQSPSVAAAPGTVISTSMPDPFGATSSSGGIFAALNQTISDLNGGNLQAVTTTDLTAVTTALGNLTNQAGAAGEAVDQFQNLTNQISSAIAQIQAQVSSLQGLNYAEVTTQYQTLLNNYQVALYAAAQVKQPTLASYLS
jgi:flagellar hook-associated protein 3 FlgL